MRSTSGGSAGVAGIILGFLIWLIVGIVTGDIGNMLLYGAGIGAAVGSVARVLWWLSHLGRRL